MAEKSFRLLAVDDDDLILHAIQLALPDSWRMVGMNNLNQPPKDLFHAAFVDMHLTGNLEIAEGLKVVSQLSASNPHLEIVAISGHLDRTLMEDCLKAGASRFLAKPLSAEEISLILNKIEAYHLLQQASQRKGDICWIGESTSSQEIRKKISQLHGEIGPILIEGESGSGKEVVAQLISSQEPNRPLVQLNAAALPENLFESELFGHIKGAFTGADQNKMGLVEAAHGGDLFLDEIEAMPLSVQPKLLRFLESGEIRRVGSQDTRKVQVRVIAATNRKLEDLVSQGKFREDLLWRLSGKKISLPPLRSHKDDIPALAEFFLQRERPKRNKNFDPDAIEIMRDYGWPGNVRELKRVIEQVSLTSPLPIIRAEDIRSVLSPQKHKQNGEPVDLSRGLQTLLNEYEAEIVSQALRHKNDIDETAKLLGISRSSLYKKIKDYSLETPS